MFEFPKLVFLIVIFAAIWIVYRWVDGRGRALQRRCGSPRPHTIATEDLVACGVCGAYVAANAPSCVRPHCPQPR